MASLALAQIQCEASHAKTKLLFSWVSTWPRSEKGLLLSTKTQLYLTHLKELHACHSHVIANCCQRPIFTCIFSPLFSVCLLIQVGRIDFNIFVDLYLYSHNLCTWSSGVIALGLCNLLPSNFCSSQKSTTLRTLADRAFTHAAPVLWNSLSLSIRTSSNLASFRKQREKNIFTFRKAECKAPLNNFILLAQYKFIVNFLRGLSIVALLRLKAILIVPQVSSPIPHARYSPPY